MRSHHNQVGVKFGRHIQDRLNRRSLTEERRSVEWLQPHGSTNEFLQAALGAGPPLLRLLCQLRELAMGEVRRGGEAVGVEHGETSVLAARHSRSVVESVRRAIAEVNRAKDVFENA